MRKECSRTIDLATCSQSFFDGFCTCERSMVARVRTIYFLSSSAKRNFFKFASVVSRNIGIGKGSGRWPICLKYTIVQHFFTELYTCAFIPLCVLSLYLLCWRQQVRLPVTVYYKYNGYSQVWVTFPLFGVVPLIDEEQEAGGEKTRSTVSSDFEQHYIWCPFTHYFLWFLL